VVLVNTVAVCARSIAHVNTVSGWQLGGAQLA
jgi:hypothetical protein